MGRIKTDGSSGHVFEGCRFHKPRHVFDTMCNACLVRSLQVLDGELKELKEKLNGMDNTRSS